MSSPSSLRASVSASVTAETGSPEVQLLRAAPKPPSPREQLLSHVWGYDFDPRSNVVDVYVGYLRKKLGKQAISSVRGMGYRLERSADA
jgi:DNA-binding response OmpR family regulator